MSMIQDKCKYCESCKSSKSCEPDNASSECVDIDCKNDECLCKPKHMWPGYVIDIFDEKWS